MKFAAAQLLPTGILILFLLPGYTGFFMDEYTIYVNQVEEWQMLNDTHALDTVFQRARRNLVGGGTVVLARKNTGGKTDRFDEMSTLDDLETYRKNVYKNLH